MRFLVTALLLFSIPALGDERPVREKLLQGDVKGLESHLVLSERLTVPAHFTAPYHHHPVEEFLYILEGAAIVRFRDGEDVQVKTGDLFTIPAGRVHTAVTTDQSLKALIFRVHPKGQPIAIPYRD